MEEMENNRRMLDEFRRQQEEYKAKMESHQADNKKRHEEDAKLKVIPHLKNINQDPIMSGKIKYLMKNGHNSIGKKDPSGADVSVLLTGAGI